MSSSNIQERVTASLEARRDAAESRKLGTIKLTSVYTLEPIDERNWALCENGIAFNYWSTLEDALRGVARKLVNRSIRANLSATGLQELADVIERSETTIVAELRALNR